MKESPSKGPRPNSSRQHRQNVNDMGWCFEHCEPWVDLVYAGYQFKHDGVCGELHQH